MPRRLSMTLLALATCEDLSEWETDDRFLHEALDAHGVPFERTVWSDPAVEWSRFDACLLRTTWDYQERLPEFLAWAERCAAATRLLNPITIVRWNTHKSYLRELEARGAPVIPTEWLARGSRVDLDALLDTREWSQAFLKPAVGATSRETLRFDRSPEGLARARMHLDRLLPAEDLLLQPYLRSVEEEGELSAIFVERELTHGVRKLPAPGDYRVQDDWGGRDEPFTFDRRDRDLAERVVAIAACDARFAGDLGGEPLLYARADFLRDGDGALLLTELELVEPSLFFRHGHHAAEHLARALVRRGRRSRGA